MNPYAGLASNYDALTDDVNYAAYLQFFESIFLSSGTEVNSVLDLGCGTGTMTMLLDESGYDMIGVDAAPEMLNEAMEKVAEAGRVGKILLLNQRMEELDLYGTVDAAISSLDCLNYVQPAALPEVFRRLRLFVRPDGILIFDVLTEKSLRDLDGQIYCDDQDGLFCIWRGYFDESRLSCRYTLDDFAENEDGSYHRTTEEHEEFVHREDTLLDCLKSNGFTQIRAVPGEEAVGDPRRVFFIARRGK